MGLEAGAKTSYRIDFASELQEAWFDGTQTVGLTSGASVPEELIEEVLEWLAVRGFADVQEVRAAQESLLFSLPPELRKDMKAAGIQ